ncbi:fumarylacetoacetate (FAA) hydrolase [Nitratireductor aquibiodomus RA22]|uniref:Fumarylacetoacetate (FAA) hydrolase n=1 Tax=Nitratireductor aquibiodomus RA22 TaxID=1189611 RepID=I5BSE6_9HYPH|nr:fumarylacetoacetate (FAA) hydrolase [Nitratireductor aquibiodomus RA22]
MKLATLKNGTRDGRLVVVSRDLTRCTDASFLAPTLQAALDDWARIAPHLAALSESLDHGSVPAERFHEHDALSPLPRAYQWADGSAYVNHVELVRKARGAEMPESFWADPLMYQGGSDAFLAPRDPIRMADEAGASTWKERSPSSSTMCRWARRWNRHGKPSGLSCW